MQSLGIENLKKGVKLAIEFGEEIERLTKNPNKLTALIGFFDEVMQVPEVAKNIDNISAEIKDLTDDERIELKAYVANEFDIENDKLEARIEAGLDWLAATWLLVKAVK